MRALIRNKLFSLLKVCIFSGLALQCLTAKADDTPEYAAVPSMDDCHYAEHPLIRETVPHKYRIVKKYRQVTHHHYRSHHTYHFANDLSVYYPFSSPSYDDNMWPSGGCRCGESGYVISSMSSDDVTYNIMDYGALYEGRAEAAPCDDSAGD